MFYKMGTRHDRARYLCSPSQLVLSQAHRFRIHPGRVDNNSLHRNLMIGLETRRDRETDWFL